MGIEDRKLREFNRRESDILEAAFDLFAEHGIEKVTIEMIAQAAEIGKGTIYKHFKSKHEIFARLILERGKELYVAVGEIDRSLPVVEKLKKVFYLYIDLYFRDRKALNVFTKCEAMLTPDLLGEEMMLSVEKHKEMKSAQIDSLLKQGIDEGTLIESSPEVLRIIATGIFTGTMQQMLENPVEDPMEIIQTMEQILLTGILR